ncbi:cytochrome P450 [Actinomadura rugatobispora]|uniref:Cytochrome P450 n=1 Tax=Actinomadura rugatobispora TaxID=1994 RepID=A0ABW0ZS02_9ACTN|nr:cytochrome P450 [Actinomadura rugatobispora]
MGPVQSNEQSCPVVNLDYSAHRPQGEWIRTFDELRAEAPWYRNDFGPGFWMMLNHEGILEILQNPEDFSSSSVVAMDPDPAYRWIPEMLDGEEHREWRRQLAPAFSPRAIVRLEDRVRSWAREVIDRIAEQGSCDFMAEFAQIYPTTIFLDLMGLPAAELDTFMEWEHQILRSPKTEEGRVLRMRAMRAVTGYFAEVVARKRREPGDDLISAALRFRIGGKPVGEEDLLAFCLLMFMAGLDTVTATLGWSFLHLARNPEDRERIVADPELIPGAIEEFVRAYAIVLPGRKATRDTEVQGCPIKEGDMVLLPLNAATRDDGAFDDARTVRIDRSPNNHIGFGAGPHRCLGSHLARRELRIAFEEWHARIPSYRLADEGSRELLESGGQLTLTTPLHLTWDV